MKKFFLIFILGLFMTINSNAKSSDLADNDVFYNVHPITLILQFEK